MHKVACPPGAVLLQQGALPGKPYGSKYDNQRSDGDVDADEVDSGCMFYLDKGEVAIEIAGTSLTCIVHVLQCSA